MRTVTHFALTCGLFGWRTLTASNDNNRWWTAWLDAWYLLS